MQIKPERLIFCNEFWLNAFRWRKFFKMNSKQRIIFIFIFSLFSLSELFPLWLYEDKGTSGEASAGYHFVFSPAPEVKASEIKRIFPNLYGNMPEPFPIKQFVVHKDSLRLYSQRAILVFFWLGLFLLLNGEISYSQIALGISSLIAALGIVAFYIYCYFLIYWRWSWR